MREQTLRRSYCHCLFDKKHTRLGLCGSLGIYIFMGPTGHVGEKDEGHKGPHSLIASKAKGRVNSPLFPWVGRRFHGKESSPLEAIRELG